MKKQYPLLLLLLIPFLSISQEIEPKEKPSNKGRIYVFWGWNRGWYTNSDIHFTGNNYDFELTNVKAYDRQSSFGIDPYLNPNRITIPQTNLRIGYFINDKYDISIGVDHMKYVMRNGQTVKINGNIDDGTLFDENYNNEDILLTQAFLIFEHSDGLNYLNAELTRNDDLLKLFKVNWNSDIVQINTLIGFGLGPVMPKSNVTLWNNARNDEFHFAGYGFAGKVGLNVTFFKHIFFRGELKEGFVNLPDVLTSPDHSDKASHHFFFTELNIDIGFTFNPFNKREN
ncbi:MAG: hypothetical protein J5I47_09485 [Vicingus serpentipes]|nr:hypothetical protein [Vicingus serpentipes]